MIYKNTDIPSSYKYIAKISDNYIVWVDERQLKSNTDYDAYIQFLNPSFSYIFINDYRITNGDNYTFNANYINNGIYSYIDNYELEYTLNTYATNSGDLITNDYGRSDFPSIFICGIVLTCIYAILLIRLLPKTRR